MTTITRAPELTSPVLVVDDITPLERYLREQQTMTAVDRFARQHDDGQVPDQARYYRDLVPLDRPAAGQQYGFEVDLDACSGCKACVTACHNLNGLDDGESFRSVGALFGTRPIDPIDPIGPIAASAEPALRLSALLVEPWQQTVTTACHHCVDPACLNGCPVDAYEKDPFTGIVTHLDDQCIGCSYCTLMCPYEVPTYNASRGIVRKCDLCSDRLAAGEAPACVQACPTSAISVTIVDIAEAIVAAEAERDATLVPGAPRSALTIPTTRYRSTRPLPADALAADHFSLRRAHAHPPLTVMLVLTQLAVGAFVSGWLLDRLASPALAAIVRPYEAVLALGVGVLALAASTLHLGRPQYAWRAVIGLRHSWLSREIVAFGLFAGLAAAYAFAVFADVGSVMLGLLGAAAAVTGIVGVACSVMIYVVTRRTWWRASHTAPKFVLTAVTTGSAAAMVALLGAGAVGHGAAADAALVIDAMRPLAIVMLIGAVAKLAGEAMIFRHLRDRSYTDLRRTAMLLRDDLHAVTATRFLTGTFGGVLCPVILLASAADAPRDTGPLLVMAVIALATTTIGELCERWQFFTAITSPRMPGVLS